MTALLDERPTTDPFATPLYTVAETSRYLGVPVSTARNWAQGYRHRTGGHPEVLGNPS